MLIRLTCINGDPIVINTQHIVEIATFYESSSRINTSSGRDYTVIGTPDEILKLASPAYILKRDGSPLEIAGGMIPESLLDS